MHKPVEPELKIEIIQRVEEPNWEASPSLGCFYPLKKKLESLFSFT